MTNAEGGERIAKILARHGYCSRREAERWIAAGRIAIDGSVIDSPAVLVTDSMSISVDGKKLKEAEQTRLWLYHKPKGLMTTHHDPQGRPTVFAHLPANLPRVISVGRLDFNTEGLLLLTTDGALARKLELPATGWVRTYQARVFGTGDFDDISHQVASGLTIAGIRYAPGTLRLLRGSGRNHWLEMAIREGKNREVRVIFEHFGLTVNRLIRTSYGPFHLDGLAVGGVKEIPGQQVKHL